MTTNAKVTAVLLFTMAVLAAPLFRDLALDLWTHLRHCRARSDAESVQEWKRFRKDLAEADGHPIGPDR